MKRESLRFILAGGEVLIWERSVGGLVYWRAWAFLRLLAQTSQQWTVLEVLGMHSQGLVVLVCLEKTWQSAKIREAERKGRDDDKKKGYPVISVPAAITTCTLGLGMQRPD